MKDIKDFIKQTIYESNETAIEKWANESGFYDELWNALTDWDWDSWNSAGSTDKEDVLHIALSNMKNPKYQEEDLYELFWQWAGGLDEECFED